MSCESSAVSFLRSHERALVGGFCLVQWLVGYFSLNAFSAGRQAYRLETWVDRLFPQIPIWIYVYCLAYVCCLAPTVFLSKPRLRTTCVAYTLTIVTSLAVFLIAPVEIVRPEPPADSSGVWLVQLTRQVDGPYNCFPSLHVSLDLLAALVCSTERPVIGGVLLIITLFISLSTLLVKQHWFLDIVSGLLLAIAAFRVVMSERCRRWTGDLEQWGQPA